MNNYSDKFLKAGVIYLLASCLLGIMMAAFSGRIGVFRPVHAHLVLSGFVSMFIFGISYATIPKAKGFSEDISLPVAAHFWLGNVGVIGMCLSFVYSIGPYYAATVALFGALQLIASLIFAYLLWRMLS